MQLISAICRVITAHNPYFVPVELLLTLKNSFMHSTLNSVAHRVADPTKVHVLHYLYPHHHNTTTSTTTSTRSSRPFHHAQRARLVLIPISLSYPFSQQLGSPIQVRLYPYPIQLCGRVLNETNKHKTNKSPHPPSSPVEYMLSSQNKFLHPFIP